MINRDAARFRFFISLAMASLACAEHRGRSTRSDKETTHVIVRWTQVDGVTLHDGTPRYARHDVAFAVFRTVVVELAIMTFLGRRAEPQTVLVRAQVQGGRLC